jgi:hypothetical protein
MDFTVMTKLSEFSSVSEWLDHVLIDSHRIKELISIHFEGFSEFSESRESSEKYISFCCKIIDEVFNAPNNNRIKASGYYSHVRIYFDDILAIAPWDSGLIHQLQIMQKRRTFPPPEIFLSKRDVRVTFPPKYEEYRIPVTVPEITNLSTLYRCWREPSDQADMEFQRVLIISPTLFEPIR